MRGRHRCRAPHRRALGVVLLAMLATAPAADARPPGPARPAQEQPQPPTTELKVSVNYVYAAQLGFGGYRVGGLSVNVYSLPIAFTLNDVLADWNLKIGVPIQYGTYHFSGTDSNGVKFTADQQTISFEPKLKLEIPLRPWWKVSPVAAFGFGQTFASSATERAPDTDRDTKSLGETTYYTYEVGVSSLVTLGTIEKVKFDLGNAFLYAGNTQLAGVQQSPEGYGSLQTGIEGRRPLGFTWQSLVPDASLFFIYYYFTPSLQFTRIEQKSLAVDNLYEIGFTLGSETPIDAPLLSDLRIGASYRVGTNLDAFRINFGFPF